MTAAIYFPALWVAAKAVLATGGSIRRVNRSGMTMKMSLVLDGDDL